MPPPAIAVVCADQLVLLPLPEVDVEPEEAEEPDDEQPAASSAAAARPASPNLYDDLISVLLEASESRSG
jgi:hypothetical protein